MNIPNDIVQQMIVKFNSGTNCTQLAKEYNYDRKLISATLKEHGISIQRGYSEKQIQDIIQLYNTGKSIRQISLELGIDRDQISRRLQKLGLRNQPDPKNSKQRFSKNTETDLIAKQYLEGKSIKQISLSISRSTNYVYNILKHYDIIDSNRLPKKYCMTWQPFHDITTQEQAYWLGFLMADGNISSESYRYNLEFGQISREKERVESFANFINTKPPIPVKERIVYTNFSPNGCHYVRVSISDVQLINDLTSWGCVPNKSLIKKFPWKLDQSLWRHFIRGYFDGNGYVYYGDN